tara:strand:+ start:3264 stop:3614 length:351 start_codon:yes stop_codon:yes gene_type:complete
MPWLLEDDMTEFDIATILLSVIAALTSTKAWDFWKVRSAQKLRLKMVETKEENLYRDDLRAEVSDLRRKLSDAHDRRDQEYREMSAKIQELVAQVAQLQTQIHFLEQENVLLKQAH